METFTNIFGEMKIAISVYIDPNFRIFSVRADISSSDNNRLELKKIRVSLKKILVAHFQSETNHILCLPQYIKLIKGLE